INKVLKQKGEIGMAATVLAAISKDEHERAKRMSQRKWETDVTNNILVAEKRGEKKGEKKGKATERKKWQNVIASKDAKLADTDAKLADNEAKLADKDAKLADKDAKLADKDAEIARLRAMIKE
ncbi:MAG: hypothetical protein LBD23_20435, partial [Oscillospiraceae bacterium]|nr:hypothetical protein [Oscillospiraceae bacterium]